MISLAPHTGQIFDAVSCLNCIRGYFLVGGTALSLQIQNRQSEDLDFMRWRTSKDEKMEVDWAGIRKGLETIAPVENMNLLDIDHVVFVVQSVKISFYAAPRYSPVAEPVHIQNNLYAADLQSIGAMKMEVMLRRSVFRDYYDIYSLLQAGVSLQAMIDLALQHSNHVLHTKNLLAMLTNCQRFVPDSNFAQLNPKYDVTPTDIELYIRKQINTNNTIGF